MVVRDVVAGAVVLISSFAFPEVTCLPRIAMGDELKKQYGEVPDQMGKIGQSVLELFVSKDGSTWSIVITEPSFVSCLMLHGKTLIKVNDRKTSN